jgi:hypothetical protein
MAITSNYGNEVKLVSREGDGLMAFDELVHGIRLCDNQPRVYRAGSDLSAPGGIAEIAEVVESLPRTIEPNRTQPLPHVTR